MAKRVTIQPNLFDRMVMAVDPIRGQKRLMARAQIDYAMGAYTGADRGRNATKNWAVSNNDADSDLLPELETLRTRSRDLIRNNPLACGALNTKVTNIVGTGLRVQAQVDADYLGLSEEDAEAWNAAAEREFRLFAESSECDIERTLSFNLIQDLVLRSVFADGDIFVNLPFIERDGFPWGTKLQLIEADRVRNENDAADSDSLAGGVEKDTHGAPMRYHVLEAHPGNYKSKKSGKWTKLDAFGANGRRNVLHVHKKLRPGQTRGLPDLSPVIEAFKQLGRYTEAELMAAVVSGMFTVFVETENGEGIPGVTASGASDQRSDIEMGYGAVIDLASGEKVHTADPGRPNTAFDPFILAILRQIGVALELPYEIMIKHFTASYSASRAALLEAWRMFKARRRWFAEMFCRPVYETVITESVLRGRLYAPGFAEDFGIRQAYLRSAWTGDAPGQLDPLKEVNAAKIRIEEDLSTRARETVELTGGDWDQNVMQRGREERRRRELKLGQQENPPAQPMQQETQQPDQQDDESDDTDTDN